MKLLVIRVALLALQLSTAVVAAAIVVWRHTTALHVLSAPSADRLAEQLRGMDGESVAVVAMCAAVVVVSLVGAVGAARSPSGACQLHFYVTTEIIFLFVTCVALCGTIWELVSGATSPASAITEETAVPWQQSAKSLGLSLVAAAVFALSIRLSRRILDDAENLVDDDDSGRHFDIDTANDDKDSGFTRV
ncbi:uncharacterized protein LOC128963949 [Oppia nitens]|uniref:uncharacterized protein LOC128963949 n=1 Tax=Oppia nitens TaxID=1686743 RepID=UPI0023DC0FFF|nr:uncharacterized protein LOC128963949 [Oppia nitens]